MSTRREHAGGGGFGVLQPFGRVPEAGREALGLAAYSADSNSSSSSVVSAGTPFLSSTARSW